MPKGVYKRTPEICRSLSIAAKKRGCDWLISYSNNGIGRPCSEETRKKISKSKKGKNNGGGWNKGIPANDEIKKRISKSLKGNTNASGGKGRISPWKGKTPSKEVKEKLRNARIKQIEKMYNLKNGLLPNYNSDACELFDLINKDTNTNGQFATNGGERKVCGYFLDYINDKLKMIIEYDEKYHYNIFGNLKKKDIERQKIIQGIYPDYKFIRIKGV